MDSSFFTQKNCKNLAPREGTLSSDSITRNQASIKFHNITQSSSWIYLSYTLLACSVTAGLNILHTKYILGIELAASLFIVPMIAGIIFGYFSAKLRVATRISQQGNGLIFAKYILFSCFITSALNILHTEWVLQRSISLELFIAPLIAGFFFGYLLAKIKVLNLGLEKLATTDCLTKTFNRLYFDNALSHAVNHIQRYGGTFSVIYFDVDNFKQINDEHGHHVGDQVLKQLAQLIKSQIHHGDILARYGGEEFIILSPTICAIQAKKLANTLRDKVVSHHFPSVEQLTCSFGVVEYSPENASARTLLQSADKALYNAKHAGRNCVVTA